MNNSDTEAKFRRVKAIREKMDKIKQRKSELTGEIEGNKKRLADLKKECMDKYQVDISTLPDLIKKLDAEATEAIEQAENILGMR